MSNTAGVLKKTGSDYHSRAPGCIPGFVDGACDVLSCVSFCLRPVSCVHNVAIVFLDCRFVIAPSVFSSMYLPFD
jgi:hypothetical protein